MKQSESMKKKIKEKGHNWYGMKHIEKSKKIQSIRACERIKNSPYSKHYNYKNIILESSYEYRFALILDELNIKWIKDRSIWFEWLDQKSNKIRRYTPDFHLPDYNIFIDTKNDYLIKKDSYKIKQVIKRNNINLIILNNTQINKTKIQQMNKVWMINLKQTTLRW